MRKALHLLCLFLLPFLLFSCMRDVEIFMDKLPPRIVLNASNKPGLEVRAHLSKAWFILDSVPDYGLPGATVRVFVNNSFRGVMRPDDVPGDTISGKGQYVLPGCYVKSGDHLRFEVEAEDYEMAVGETEIPAKTDILRLDTMVYIPLLTNIDSKKMRISTTMGLTGPGYYRLMVNKVGDYRKGDSIRSVEFGQNVGGGYNYYSGFMLSYEDPVFQSFGGSPIVNQLDGIYCMGVFATNAFEPSKTVKVSLWPIEYSYKSDSLDAIVHYDVSLLSISEGYYRYLKVIRGFSIQVGNANFGALVEPADAYSNVENGFGLVAGYELSAARITMPTDTVKPSWNPWDGYAPTIPF